MSHIERKDGVVTIKPGIDIVAAKCEGLKAEFIDIINTGEKKIIIDMATIEMIDSSGLGLLISTKNSLIDAGGHEVEIINICSDIMQLFKVMRLDTHFTLTE